jgi:hypothetical protein
MTCIDEKIGKLIGNYELSLLTKEERRQFENHLLDCEYCFQSLYQTAPLAVLMREGRVAPARDIDLADDEAKAGTNAKPRKKSSIRTFRRFWVYGAAGAVTLMAVALIVMLIQEPWKKAEQLRGHDEVSILVISPVGEVTALRELRWKAVAGIDSYDVKIYTKDGELVWEGSTTDTKIVLPDSINEILIQRLNYFWQVEAVTDKGEFMKSQIVRFSIRK